MDQDNLSFVVYSRSSRRGQVALAMTFVIGGLIVFAGLLMAFLVLSFLNSVTGFQMANRASALASAGIYDALLRFDRDKDLTSTSYSIPLDAYAIDVTITQNSPVANQATILSSASVMGYLRRIQAIVSIVSSTGQIDLLSWTML